MRFDPFACHSNFVPREELMGSMIFARAKRMAGIRIPMFVTREDAGFRVRFEDYFEGVKIGCSFLVDWGILESSNDKMMVIGRMMDDVFMAYIRKIDSVSLLAWYQYDFRHVFARKS